MTASNLARSLAPVTRGRLLALAVVASALIVGAWIATVQPADACTGAGCGARSALSQSFAFSSSGQSLWGAGSQATDSYSTNVINRSQTDFSKTLNVGGISGYCFKDFAEQKLGSTIGDALVKIVGNPCSSFGATLNGSISGGFGADVTLASGAGSVSVDHAANVGVNYPSAYTFAPGTTVRLQVTATEGTTHLVATPPTVTVTPSFNGALSGSGSAKGCLGGCKSDSLYNESVSGTLSYPVSGAGLDLPLQKTTLTDPSAILAAASGMTGYLGTPGLSHDTTGTGAVTSTQSDEFTNVKIDLGTWLQRVFGGGSLTKKLLFTAAEKLSGANVAVNIFDGTANVGLTEGQTLTFTPRTMVTLTFSQAVTYAVNGSQGTTTGNGTTVTVPSGTSIDVTMPAGSETPITVTTSVALDGTFHNLTQLTRDSSLSLTGLSASLSTPGATIFGSHCITVLTVQYCTPSLGWNAWSRSGGPVLNEPNLLPVSLTDTVFDKSWSLGGFSSAAGKSLTLQPDTPPQITVGQPAATTEGVPVTLTGTIASHAPGLFSAVITWGDGHSDTLSLRAGATGYTATHIYRDPGTAIPIHVKVTDGVGLSGSADTSIAVAPAPPVVTVAPDTATAFSAKSFPTLATFTNPGLDDTFTASINWGDGLTSAGTVSGSNGQWTVSADHTFQDAGALTVTVTVTDADGITGSSSATYQVTGGRAFFRDALNDLQPFASGSRSIAEPVHLLQQILNDRNWVSDVTLTTRGRQVFELSANAAEQLQRALNTADGQGHAQLSDSRAGGHTVADGHDHQPALSAAAQAAVQAALVRMVQADRILAQHAINQVPASGLTREQARTFARAQQAFSDANQLAAAGKAPEAMRRYAEAWSSTEQLLGELNRHGDHEGGDAARGSHPATPSAH